MLNHIVFNREQAMIENYFKNLSNNLQEAYEEEGKYLFLGSHFHLAITYIFVGLLTLVSLLKTNVATPIGVLVLTTEALFFLILYCCEDIFKNIKLPIISKKQFLKKKNDILKSIFYGFDLNDDEVIVNSKKLEIKLNYDSPTLPEKMRIREQKARLGREYRERNER